MAIEINILKDDEILVNGKPVYKDQNDNWIAQIELTQSEAKALNQHLNSTKPEYDTR